MAGLSDANQEQISEIIHRKYGGKCPACGGRDLAIEQKTFFVPGGEIVPGQTRVDPVPKGLPVRLVTCRECANIIVLNLPALLNII